jgi:phage minor structural protein
MLKLFGITDRDFTSNGDKTIKPLRARITKQDNGEFYLELETDLTYVNDLTEGRIIMAPTPQGEQPFRVSNLQKTKNKLITKALHVFFDSRNYLIADSYVVEKNCNAALDHLNEATEPQSPFVTISDVDTVNNYRCVRTSLYEAVMTVVERWGGHLDLNGWTIGIRQEIGQDNGVVVRYAKNLKDITVDENWDNVTTKLLPVGKEGLLLPETYVTSTNQYDLPYVKSVNFDQNDIEQEDYIDAEGNPDVEAYEAALVEDLRQKAQSYVDNNSVPQVNYTLKANLEKLTNIGDTVYVQDDRLGLTVTTQVISYIYDCILGQYVELEFGNFKQTVSGLMNTITNQIQETVEQNTKDIQVTLGEELREAQNKIWAALGNSYVIYEGDKILVVDSLPKETARNVIMINNGGIGFSQSGINGPFRSAWTIDNVFNAEQINVVNFTADLIRGGTLKLGSKLNDYGTLEIYDEANVLIALMDKNGLKMYGQDGSYVVMNQEEGFAGYDRNGEKIFWADYDEFHMKKSVVEEEITLCGSMRFIAIKRYNDNNQLINQGIGLVPVGGQ